MKVQGYWNLISWTGHSGVPGSEQVLEPGYLDVLIFQITEYDRIKILGSTYIHDNTGLLER